MKLVTFSSGVDPRVGVVDADAGLVRDVTALLPAGAGVLEVIEGWAALGPVLAAYAGELPAQALDGLSKAGVTHLTRSAAAEVGKQGIRVNEIAPALLTPEMVKQYFEGPNAIPLDPVIAKLALDHVGKPEDGAAAVLFLCSEQADYITGVVLPVDGGFLLHNAGSAEAPELLAEDVATFQCA